MGGDYCEVGRGGVTARGEAGRRIKVVEDDIGFWEGLCDEGTPLSSLVYMLSENARQKSYWF